MNQDMERRTGATTRIIDKAVQDFFIYGYAICVDHHTDGKKVTAVRMSKYIARKVAERLDREHHGIVLSVKQEKEHNNMYVVRRTGNKY